MSIFSITVLLFHELIFQAIFWVDIKSLNKVELIYNLSQVIIITSLLSQHEIDSNHNEKALLRFECEKQKICSKTQALLKLNAYPPKGIKN